LRPRTHFRRYRGRRVPFSFFCAPGLVFGGTEGVGFHFHVLRSRTCFRRYRGRRVLFSCFCALGHVFGITEGVGNRFHVLRSRTRFRRCRGRRVPFSYFACLDSFSAIPRASGPVFTFSAVPCAMGPVFMFCTPGLVFGGIESVRSHFHVLRSRTHFRRYLGRWFPFFMFCAPGLVFGGTEGVTSRFHVLCSRTSFGGAECVDSLFQVLRTDSFSAVPRASGPDFMFCAPGLIVDGVGSRFHVLRSRNRFRRYRGRRVPFSRFALPDSFSAVPRASGPFFMFFAPGLVFGGTEGVGSRFHVLRSRTHFRRYRGRRVPFSCFALPDSFSAVPRASGPIFMFCALGLLLSGTEGVGSRFHVLRSRTRFQRFRRRRVSVSYFALPDKFSMLPMASGSFFLFCAPGQVFGGTDGVGFLFHVLRSRTHFQRY
jgi:hypothetical protein